MGDISSLWGYDEYQEVEHLGQKLLFTTLELEKLKAEADEETRKNKEDVNQLIQLLNFAVKERDEAKNQLQNLLTKPPISHFQSNIPLATPRKPNSTITESNSHDSSPVDSLFDPPEFSNVNLGFNKPFVQGTNAPLSYNHVPRIDHGSMIIDNLARGKTLPQKGKFLETVLGAGPLLQTLLLSGPLPRWRNPPQVQAFQVPPVSVKGSSDVNSFTPKPASSTLGPMAFKSLKSPPYAHTSCGSSQVLSTPRFDFSNVVASGSRLSNGSMMSSGMNTSSYGVPLAKRQRFC